MTRLIFQRQYNILIMSTGQSTIFVQTEIFQQLVDGLQCNFAQIFMFPRGLSLLTGDSLTFLCLAQSTTGPHCSFTGTGLSWCSQPGFHFPFLFGMGQNTCTSGRKLIHLFHFASSSIRFNFDMQKCKTLQCQASVREGMGLGGHYCFLFYSFTA